MENLQTILQTILSAPTPEALMMLQGRLLRSAPPGEPTDRCLDIAGHFHAFLSELQAKITARQYSELASKLDIGAVGTVVLENILSSDSGDFLKRLLLGSLAEGLMVGASRQYIKAWQAETVLVHSRATWYLTEALWRTSTEMQPDLSADQRWEAIQTLLAPARDADTPAPDKAVLLGRIYQILLLTHLGRLLAKAEE